MLETILSFQLNSITNANANLALLYVDLNNE